MIARIRAYVRGVLEVRRVERAFLAAQDGKRAFLAAQYGPTLVHDCNDHESLAIGATEQWSPIAEIDEVIEHEEEAEARAELAAAAADLKPMLDDFHRAMAKAWRDFDAGMLAPMHTTARWHQAGADCCQQCAQQRSRTFGAIGERFGIRSFRMDTPTAEYLVIGTDRTHARELVPA